ncbi:MAG: chemotaxis protein CheW [Spirochaetales bacterium]|nr:chemotaxis protein CheW [Spirochaetales bacterium]
MNDLDIQTGEQFLAFTLRDEEYAIDITKVREVLDVTTLTKIPRMPSYLCGVINLRGNVVPVIDLGLRLGLPPISFTVNSCIMIMEILVGDDEESVLMGAMTDMVKTVLEIPPESIEPPPRMGINISTDFITGMGRDDEKFLIILNIDKVLTTEGEAVLQDQQSGLLDEVEA